MSARYTDRCQKSENGVGESRVRDVGKGITTVGTTSATKPEVEIWQKPQKNELATIDFLFDPIHYGVYLDAIDHFTDETLLGLLRQL